MPAGMRVGRSGRPARASAGQPARRRWSSRPGGLALVDLPAGERATIDVSGSATPSTSGRGSGAPQLEVAGRPRRAARRPARRAAADAGPAGAPARLARGVAGRRLAGVRRVTINGSATPGWSPRSRAPTLVDGRPRGPVRAGLGDRPLVEVGADRQPGDPLVEHLRRPADRGGRGPGPARRWTRCRAVAGRPLVAARAAARAFGATPAHDGELLSLVPGQTDRWRIVDRRPARTTATTPVGGDVVAVRAGGEVRLRVAGRALRGAFAAGSPARAASSSRRTRSATSGPAASTSGERAASSSSARASTPRR